MKVKHYLNGQAPAKAVPVIEWQLIYSEHMKGPVLQGRNPGGTWQNVVCVDSDGLLDPTYCPDLDGLQCGVDGYPACVEAYPGGDEE